MKCLLWNEIKKSLSHKNNVFNIFKVRYSAGNQFSNHTPHFEESLEVINLTKSHGDQDKGLEHWPHDDSAVGVFVDCSVDSVSDLHILLLMLDPCQSSAQLLDQSCKEDSLKILGVLCKGSIMEGRTAWYLVNGFVATLRLNNRPINMAYTRDD